MKKIFFFTTLVIVSFLQCEKSFAQKKLILEYEAVVAAAKAELDTMMQPGGALQLESVKLNIKGEYVIDLTIYDKGKVLSVFMVSSDAGEIKMQNAAKDLIRRAVFNFKMPKDKTYKLQYTFNFK